MSNKPYIKTPQPITEPIGPRMRNKMVPIALAYALLIVPPIVFLNASGVSVQFPWDTLSGYWFLIIFTSIFLALYVWRVRLRASYRKAFQHPDPSKILAVTDRVALASSASPGGDAGRAQSRAFAFSFYGDEEGAARALSEVPWNTKAPIQQAMGLYGEAVVEFLCHRNAKRGLDLSRRARELARVDSRAPGARGTLKAYDTLVAIGEILSNEFSLETLDDLDREFRRLKLSPRKLLVAFALQVGMAQVGKTERAEELRSFLRDTVPYCAPLLDPSFDYTTSAQAVAERPTGPVSVALMSPHPSALAPPTTTATKKYWILVALAGCVTSFVLFYQWSIRSLGN